jgi:hypothetical protein
MIGLVMLLSDEPAEPRLPNWTKRASRLLWHVSDSASWFLGIPGGTSHLKHLITSIHSDVQLKDC